MTTPTPDNLPGEHGPELFHTETGVIVNPTAVSRGRIGVENLYKFVLLVLLIVCTTALMFGGVVSSEAGLPVITGASLYGLGNGITARKGQAVTPAIGRRSRS